jgi:hypothetical protein
LAGILSSCCSATSLHSCFFFIFGCTCGPPNPVFRMLTCCYSQSTKPNEWHTTHLLGDEHSGQNLVSWEHVWEWWSEDHITEAEDRQKRENFATKTQSCSSVASRSIRMHIAHKTEPPQNTNYAPCISQKAKTGKRNVPMLLLHGRRG